jgi:molybdate transport system ATP-binding protein
MLAVELRSRLGALELNVAFDVPAGTCLALAGPSGAGKTTILRMIAGLARPDNGRIECGGELWLDTRAAVNLAPERRRCGYVFQDYALFGHLSAWRNVAYGLDGVPRGERRARAVELLERFGIAGLADARPATLSGGERQRVAVARALARRPDVLLLDEPLAALDVSSRAHAGRELTSVLAELGVPSVLVTHDFMEAALTGDRIAVIDGGQIVQTGSAGELAAEPATPFVADFTGANVLRGEAHQRDDGLTEVALHGGGTVVSTDTAGGAVAVGVHPWEIAIEPPGAAHAGSAQNHLGAEVTSVTAIGNRVRIGLASPQPLVAEVTGAAVDRLALAPGARVTATWKAAATRLLAL